MAEGTVPRLPVQTEEPTDKTDTEVPTEITDTERVSNKTDDDKGSNLETDSDSDTGVEDVHENAFNRFERSRLPIKYRNRLTSHSAPSSPTRQPVAQLPRKTNSHPNLRKLLGGFIGPIYSENDLEWDDYNDQPSFVEPGTEQPLDIDLNTSGTIDNLFEVEETNLPNTVGISKNPEINLTEINPGDVLETNKEQDLTETEESNTDNVEMAPNQNENSRWQFGTKRKVSPFKFEISRSSVEVHWGPVEVQ